MARVKKKGVVLRAVQPNAGVQAAYRRKLYALVDAMHRSIDYWLRASYRENEPVMAQDATPAKELEKAVRALRDQWQERFDDAAEEMADFFAETSRTHTESQFRSILKRGGFAVKFKMSPAMRDVVAAQVAENVTLIRSIPQQYLTQVEGMVMRSVQRGRDVGYLTKELQRQYGITKRRAAFIALDQSNKATATVTQTRQIELGLTEAIWQHSGAGRKPRPKHVAADGERYDVRKGLKIGDRGEWVLPGEAPRCRCTSRTVIPGF